MKGLEQRAEEYTARIFNGATPSEVVKAYIVGATEETRELKRELEEERFVTKDLKKQIKKMKCCENCINNYFLATEEPCYSCTRCYTYTRTTRKTTDKWEIEEK